MSIQQHPYIISAGRRMLIREGRASAWDVLYWIASGSVSVRSWWRCRKHRARQRQLVAAGPVAQARARVARLEVARARFVSTGATDLVAVVDEKLAAERRELAELQEERR